MTGLDKIVSEINDEAKAEAEAIIQKANDEAAEIKAAAQTAGQAQADKILAQAKQDVADIGRSRESAQALQHRQRTLETKQTLLAETLDKALEALRGLPNWDYFNLLMRLAAASAQEGEGVMMLSAEDRQKLPSGFEHDLNSALTGGKSLKISDETRPIDGGFVLKYGDIEENCSFAAIFDARREEFIDKIQGVLFA